MRVLLKRSISLGEMVRAKLAEKSATLQQLLVQPAPSEAQRSLIQELLPAADQYEKLREIDAALRNCEAGLAEEKDQECLQLYRSELAELGEKSKELEEEALEGLLEPEPFSRCEDVKMHFMPGVGGSESALFAKDLFEMYEGYCSLAGLSVRDSGRMEDDNGGIKSGWLRVLGRGAYQRLSCERGAHKVIRVPATEAKGRLHSSTAIVVVMPEVPDTFEVSERDIRYEFMRSSGAGGQHVNKTESACRATHIPTGISVHIQEMKQQERNKQRATALLKERVFALHHDQVLADRNRLSREQKGTGERSDKIRTYNFPQDRITDHRTGLTLPGIQRMLEGRLLEQFIEAALLQQREERLRRFLAP